MFNSNITIKLLKAFSLIELSIVLLIIGIVTIVALNGRSLVTKANCVVSSFGSKTITDNLNNPTALTKNRSTTYENCVTSGSIGSSNTCSGLTCTSCKTLLDANPGIASGTYTIDPDGTGGLASFSAYCDMTTDSGGWTLVGITNSVNTIANVDNAFSVTNNYTGSYVKRLAGLSGTDSMFDCGTSDQGVKGVIILANGSWNWPAASTLQISSNFTVKSSNLTWNPDLPGYDSTDSDSIWINHLAGIHFNNIGSQAFSNTITNGANYTTFSCDPQNNAYGSGYTAWFSGATGTKYIRYWLR